MQIGLGRTLTDRQREALLAVAPFWTRRFSEEQMREIMYEILSCFDYWKLSRADRNGQVRVFHPHSVDLLLSHPRGKLEPGKHVAPWHCAGPFVQNEIDMAFKLWLDSDARFDVIISRYGTAPVFALCGGLAIRRKDVDPDSMIRLCGFLGEQLALYADVTSEMILSKRDTLDQRHRQDEGLKTARDVSAQKRTEKARQQHEDIRRMAFEYFQHRPADSVGAAIAHISAYVRLSPTTIEAKIKGIRAEALRSLNRDHPR